MELGGSKSSIRKTGPNGVVQGGKSSGELFLYYLNDLPLQLNQQITIDDKGNSSGKEFVDDVNILSRATTMEKLLKQVSSDFIKVQQYLINHKMCINNSKTQLMILHPPKDKSSLKISCDWSIITHQDKKKDTRGHTIIKHEV